MRRGTYSEGTGTPWRATTDLRNIHQQSKSMRVPKRNEDHSVVSQSRHGICTSHLLSTTWGGTRDKETNVLPSEATGSPETTGLVNEGLPLAREVTVTGGDTEEEGIVLCELVDGDVWVVGLCRCVHLEEDFRGEGLWDPVKRESMLVGLFGIMGIICED